MVEFVFSVTLANGAKLNYTLRAKDKLDAFAKIRTRFPDAKEITKLKP